MPAGTKLNRIDTFSHTFIYHTAEFIVKDGAKEYITDIAKHFFSLSVNQTKTCMSHIRHLC